MARSSTIQSNEASPRQARGRQSHKILFKTRFYSPYIWQLSFLNATIFSLKAKTKPWQTAILTAAGVGVLMLFAYFLNLSFPEGVLF